MSISREKVLPHHPNKKEGKNFAMCNKESERKDFAMLNRESNASNKEEGKFVTYDKESNASNKEEVIDSVTCN